MSAMAESKVLVKGTPFNKPVIKGKLENNYDMSQDEVSLLLFLKTHGGKIPLYRIKNETGLKDPESVLKNLMDYGFALEDKERLGEKIVLTSEGEFVAQAIRVRDEELRLKEMKQKKNVNRSSAPPQ
ncbi:TVG0766549 [Thermoplasma volcanium GSS1]|uniref:TVG0766549 protein n=2 Tax=Thermoplasma volcanium TaxID=50339 RepID=Q97AP8_THEVO|nr:TVG0766549 [Thermoplasma volcanium GSS1]